jgi:hypothetical protein
LCLDPGRLDDRIAPGAFRAKPHIWGTTAAEDAMLDDPFLNYFALCLLIFVGAVLFYGIIAIHDIPAKIAKARHHPHERFQAAP